MDDPNTALLKVGTLLLLGWLVTVEQAWMLGPFVESFHETVAMVGRVSR